MNRARAWIGAALLLLVGLVPGMAGASPPAASQARETATLAADWRFMRGDVAAAAEPGLDEKDWTRVTLPHSFNAGDGEAPDYYRGPAWYRRAFEVKAITPGRRLFIQFDGAASAADVYLNGRQVGRHEGGHAAFRFDLTPALVVGRNLLAVRVDNQGTKVIAPLGGDFTLFGGLYRPVHLIESDDLHFDLMDHGGPGLYALATPAAGKARIAIRARIANDSASAREVRVLARLLDAKGREVARETATAAIAPHSTGKVALAATVAAPRLWDGVRDPYLYRLVARIGERGDEISVPLGIRSFSLDPTLGFILNGRPYPLRGANLMHSARPGKGTAVTRAEVEEDLAILREMGSTGVRLVHFQHPQSAYDAADRLGLAAWTEIGINSLIEDSPAFRANAAEQLRELIAQNYNHPSVMMWGIGNEVYSEDPSVARILAELNQVAKAADPSRPTVYAHCCQADDHAKAMVTDAIGFNRYFGWYPNQKGQSIGTWAAGFHAAHPDRAFAVSEYGAGASILHQADPPGPVDPGSSWHPEQFQSLYHERNWAELADKPYLFGSFVWVAFDLASAGRHEGDRRGINDKGLVTHDRKVRKDAYYWYQANWADKPMLHITGRRFDERHQPEVEVKAYTNAGPARLVLNGKDLGLQAPKGHILRWNARLRDGLNRIEIRNARGLVDAVEWTLARPPGMLAAPAGIPVPPRP